MGLIFLFLIAIAVLLGVATGRADALTTACLGSARDAVEISIRLVGVMAFFLGLTEVVQRAGLMQALARGLRPLFRWLFPDVPDGHPALGAMTMNMAANMIGLANAATPFGIKAMKELDTLNGRKGVSTDAMCLFLAINTSNVALFPSGTIGLRASVDSADPAGIIATTLLATSFSTLVAIFAAKLYSKLPAFRRQRPPLASTESLAGDVPDEGLAEVAGPVGAWTPWKAWASLGVLALFVASAVRYVTLRPGGAEDPGALAWTLRLVLPFVILAALLYGWARGVAVYEALVEGAKEGFQVAIRIIPFLVAILVAVGMFRASGALDAIVGAIGPALASLGFPAEALPMALLRPLSGSGAMGVMVDTMRSAGPDSFVGYLVSTMQGSTETTFYVLAVYAGAVGVRRLRHAMPACLTADAAGIVGATVACHLLLG